MDTSPVPVQSRSNRPFQVALAVLVLLAVTWYGRPDGLLHVHFLDTSGDAVLVQTPGGRFVLIDGGADPALLALHLGRRLPFWQRNLAAVVLTHADHQRLPGQVAALARYRAELALGPPTSGGATAAEWQRLLAAQQTPLYTAQAGNQLHFDGVTLTVLTVDSEAGLLLELTYGTSRIILAGTGAAPEQPFTASQPATLLAYPWQYALDAPLLQAWQAEAVVFTTAQETDRPALHSLHERTALATRLYHTRLHGSIELVSDGHSAWMLTERPLTTGHW